ncbi:MAG TPA: hypothetical protein VK915_13055 [Gaiellaceae bacterium]|nr:hypothetical protein [Gaiellaceae bacterium]
MTETPEGEPQVAWTAIEEGAAVVAGGEEHGRVAEIAGDYDADIFSGLVVRGTALEPRRFLPAERVRAIWPSRVEVDLSPEELRALPEYEEPAVERVDPYGGFLTRLRGLFRRR